MRCCLCGMILFLVLPLKLQGQSTVTLPSVETVQNQFSEQIIKLSGPKVMKVQQRKGTGPTLVLVPGTWGDLQRFIPVIRYMPEEIPVTVILLPWQGGNVPARTDFTMEELADDVLSVIQKLKLDHFVIGGHSIGGMITVEVAGRKVPGMIGAIPMEGWTHHSVVKTAFEGVVTGPLSPELQAKRQAGRLRGRRHLSDEQLKALGSIWKNWNGYAALERSQVPIQHCWGDRGKPPASREQLQIPQRPNIKIVWIKHSSHSMMLENPKQLAQTITTFMQEIETSSSK